MTSRRQGSWVHGWENLTPVLQRHDLLTGQRNFQELRLGELARYLSVFMFHEHNLSSFEMLRMDLETISRRAPGSIL